MFPTFTSLLLVLLLGSTLPVTAGVNLDSDFDAANRLYAQAKFSEAAAAYQQLIATGSVSPALYFNLGNAFFKSGQIGRALAAYQQAAALAPRDPDIRANLQFARNQVQGPTLRPGVLARNLTAVSAHEWAWLGAAGIWVTFGLLAFRQLRPALVPVLRTWTWVAALATLLSLAGLGAALAADPTRQLVIVTANETIVRSSPFTESPSAFTVNDGAELRVVDRKDDWIQVTDGAHRFGWLPREAVVRP